MQFQKWLNESVELQVAKFLEDILDKAVSLKKQNNQPFINCIKTVFPDFAFPNNFPPDVAGKPIYFQTSNNTIHKNGKFSGFILDVSHFDRGDIDQSLEDLKAKIHHEVEHIHNIGTKYHGDTMDYMNNPGEIRSHARQMAYLYNKHFPGQPFNLKNVESIPLSNTLKNYFISFAKPEVGNRDTHKEIMSLVQQFLQQYTK